MGHMKVLIAGWFSFKEGHATAGDIYARDLVSQWLENAGISHDISVAPPFSSGVDWRAVDPRVYSHIIFVCGPFEKKNLELEFLKRFEKCQLIGMNLSMFEPLDKWNPFDFLIERDSSDDANADIVFLSRQPLVPVVGVCLVEHYDNALTYEANASIRQLLSAIEAATVNIDTRLDSNSTNLRTPSEIESLISRMDLIVTTRLHGTVLALKNSVPCIAIDPVAGGHKIQRQADLIGWPIVFNADAVTDHALQKAFDYCLTAEARKKASECADRATKMVQQSRDRLIGALTDSNQIETRHRERIKKTTINGTQPETIDFGTLRDTTPFSREFGYDRGTPIDRCYIESFLEDCAGAIQGHVLEIGDDTYTRKFGCEKVVQSDVLNITADIPGTTIVGDLTEADHIPSRSFDCIIFTQTLHLIYDFRTALQTIHRIMKPGGTVLATFPGISQISSDQWGAHWCWSFTALSAQKIFEEVFPKSNISTHTFGNVLAATAFLHGLSAEELKQNELDHNDPSYEMLISVKALKNKESL